MVSAFFGVPVRFFFFYFFPPLRWGFTENYDRSVGESETGGNWRILWNCTLFRFFGGLLHFCEVERTFLLSVFCRDSLIFSQLNLRIDSVVVCFSLGSGYLWSCRDGKGAVKSRLLCYLAKVNSFGGQILGLCNDGYWRRTIFFKTLDKDEGCIVSERAEDIEIRLIVQQTRRNWCVERGEGFLVGAFWIQIPMEAFLRSNWNWGLGNQALVTGLR